MIRRVFTRVNDGSSARSYRRRSFRFSCVKPKKKAENENKNTHENSKEAHIRPRRASRERRAEVLLDGSSGELVGAQMCEQHGQRRVVAGGRGHLSVGVRVNP